MMDWTPSGQARFEAYIDSNRQSLAADGADPEEVAADLKSHIETVVGENGRTVVTEDDVVKIAGRSLGDGAPPAQAAGTTPAGEPDRDCLLAIRLNAGKPKSPARKTPGAVAIMWISLFGILLPAVTLGLELLTRMCTATLFDPLPTAWHAVAVGLVPVIHALALAALLRGQGTRWRTWGFLVGVAAGISLYYTLQFLPFVPFAVVGIVFGIGILPLSPLLAFLVYFTLRAKIRQRGALANGRKAATWPGLLAAFVLLLALDLPKAATYCGLIMATSDRPATAERGVAVLRRAGSKDQMLRLCYQRPGVFSDVMGMLYCTSGNAPSPQEARTLYYRTFGEPFNAAPPPALRGARGRPAFEWDDGVAGDTVDGRLSSLSLASSRLDASVDADGGVAYTEWTLEFKNAGYAQQEARMQVRLPSGGVVSRLTLWVDGEPREAAFAGRSEVKAAYQNVVSQRRDPVLVTTSGPDQVLVQCFPVPPNGGIMKIRFGVSAPVNPLSATEAGMALPRIVEHNFAIPDGFRHALWAESPNRLAGGRETSATQEAATGFHALRGQIPDHEMASGLVLNAARSPGISFAWTLDGRSDSPRWIIQKTIETTREKPAGLIIVVDGSRPMRAQAERLAEELAKAAPGCPVSLILAADIPALLLDRGNSPAELAKVLGRIGYAGGMDNVPALLMALDLATRQGNCPILWLHGPQPVEMTPAGNLVQHYERRPGTSPIIDGRVIAGGNLAATALHQAGALHSLRDDINAPGGVTRLVDEICGVRSMIAWQREARPEAPQEAAGKPTSDHLARLFARDEISRLLDARGEEERSQAVKLAARYQLVTPASGAVVLENAQQYKRAGLEPVGEDSVPTIPEPETWAMLIIAAAVLAGAALKKRGTRRPAAGVR